MSVFRNYSIQYTLADIHQVKVIFQSTELYSTVSISCVTADITQGYYQMQSALFKQFSSTYTELTHHNQ